MFIGNIIDNVGRLQKKIMVSLEIIVFVSLIIYGSFNFYASRSDFDPKEFSNEGYAAVAIIIYSSTLA